MKKWLISQKWFLNLFSRSYLIKVNGKWNIYWKSHNPQLKFKKGQKIEEIIGMGTRNWITCGTCGSIINFTQKHADRRCGPKIVWDYTCSCCGTVQHFLPYGLSPIPCDECGIPYS